MKYSHQKNPHLSSRKKRTTENKTMSQSSSRLNDLPSLDSFSIGVQWELPTSAQEASYSRGGRGRGGQRGAGRGRGGANDESSSHSATDFQLFCDSIVRTSDAAQSSSSPVQSVELADFQEKSANQRCFALRAADDAAIAPLKHLVVRCIASAPRTTSLASRIACHDAVVIVSTSVESRDASLHEAFATFYNSNGQRCCVIYVVVDDAQQRQHNKAPKPTVSVSADIVALMHNSFSQAAERLGGVHPTLRIVKKSDVLATANSRVSSDSTWWSRSLLAQCVSDICGEHLALRRSLQVQGRPALSRVPPPSRPSSIPSNTDVSENTNDSAACRAYVVAKDGRGKRLHVIVLGGSLQAGSRLIIPHPRGEDNGYLTVSSVEAWGQTQLSHRFAAPTKATDDDATQQQASEKQQQKQQQRQQSVFGIGSVCSCDFRQLSKHISWPDVPTDIIIGSGQIAYKRRVVSAPSSPSSPKPSPPRSPLPLSSEVRRDVWCDGMFPKRPLCLVVEAASTSQRDMLMRQCRNATTSVASPSSQTLYVSFDGQTFFEVLDVQADKPSARNIRNSTNQWAVVLKSSTPQSVEQLRSVYGIGFRNARPTRRPAATTHGMVPMRPLVARFVVLSNHHNEPAATSRPPRSAAARGSPNSSPAIPDPFLQYEFLSVIGVQGEGYYLDCVIQCCSWLDKRSTATLNSATHAMLEDGIIPVRWTVDHVSGTTTASSPARHLSSRTVGNELRRSAAPFCNGVGAYAFLLDLFVLKAGSGGSAQDDSGAAAPVPSAVGDASLGLVAATTTPSLMSSMEKNPFFAKWGHKFLIPILSSMIDLVGSSLSGPSTRATTAKLLQVFPPELMDHILQVMSPQDIPTEALATAAPLLLYRSIKSVSDYSSTGVRLLNNNQPPPCTVPAKRQQEFTRVLVDRCFDAGLEFHSTLCELLRTQMVQDHRKYTWAISESKPEEGTGSFFRRLVTCFSPSMKMADILPRDVSWVASDTTVNGVRRCTYRVPSATVPAGWNGVAVALRLYEMGRQLTTSKPAGTRPPWETLLLKQLFAAEAFIASAPPAFACDAVLFNLVMSYCYWP
ncbi:Hypothetical protein, putative [Bodo saltans]|uniref:Uncharacterized protein n=1 Tax=Bodo saltans TaxID=75058 RepID=A0A0S4JIT4_BODSA|nr:Hypothetical protein, putative [Bodo saltans]|eukprot:CUG90076.1 Hypothetical protein, putative [Bodo saltans]